MKHLGSGLCGACLKIRKRAKADDGSSEKESSSVPVGGGVSVGSGVAVGRRGKKLTVQALARQMVAIDRNEAAAGISTPQFFCIF